MCSSLLFTSWYLPGPLLLLRLLLDHPQQHYWQMKERVVDIEQLVLRVLGFDLSSFHHYRLLLNYSRSLRCSEDIVSLAWVFINDCLTTPSLLRKPPQALVCAAIYLGHKCVMGPHVPVLGEPRGETVRWWEIFDARIEDIYEVCDALLGLYEQGQRSQQRGHL